MENLTIVVPMAGMGSRFSDAGYDTPKPFINVGGEMMITKVIKTLNIPNARYIFICQESHITEERLVALESLGKNVSILCISGYTEGAAISVLQASGLFDMDDPMMILNSDQLLTIDVPKFFECVNQPNVDGAIVCFKSSGPNWSYVSVDSDNRITFVAEKVVISDTATAGAYFWKKSSDFVKSANAMIEKNERVKGEFYVAPVYNQFVDSHKVVPFICESVIQLGTPEELSLYVSN